MFVVAVLTVIFFGGFGWKIANTVWAVFLLSSVVQSHLMTKYFPTTPQDRCCGVRRLRKSSPVLTRFCSVAFVSEGK